MENRNEQEDEKEFNESIYSEKSQYDVRESY
jgi:hypothetical protein